MFVAGTSGITSHIVSRKFGHCDVDILPEAPREFPGPGTRYSGYNLVPDWWKVEEQAQGDPKQDW